MFIYKHTERIEYVKSSLLYRKKTSFTGKSLENSLDEECENFRVLFLYEPEHYSEIFKSTLVYL